MVRKAIGGVESLKAIADALGLSFIGLTSINILYRMDDAVRVEANYIAKPEDHQKFIDTVVKTYNSDVDDKIKSGDE